MGPGLYVGNWWWMAAGGEQIQGKYNKP
jgi:hypothetical protein